MKTVYCSVLVAILGLTCEATGPGEARASAESTLMMTGTYFVQGRACQIGRRKLEEGAIAKVDANDEFISLDANDSNDLKFGSLNRVFYVGRTVLSGEGGNVFAFEGEYSDAFKAFKVTETDGSRFVSTTEIVRTPKTLIISEQENPSVSDSVGSIECILVPREIGPRGLADYL